MPDSRAVVQAKYHQIEDVDPTDEDVQAVVRRLVAANAVGDTVQAKGVDAREIMLMLGVHESQKADHEFRIGPGQVNEGGL